MQSLTTSYLLKQLATKDACRRKHRAVPEERGPGVDGLVVLRDQHVDFLDADVWPLSIHFLLDQEMGIWTSTKIISNLRDACMATVVITI